MVVPSSRLSYRKVSSHRLMISSIKVLICVVFALYPWYIWKNYALLSSRLYERRDDVSYAFNDQLRTFRSADIMVDTLLKSKPEITTNDVVIEVGCHRLKQSKIAAELGYKVLSFEASPQNYDIMMTELGRQPQSVKDRITVYNKAVSDVSGSTVTFDAIGSTGDHVSGMNLDQAQKTKYDTRKDSKITVGTVSLDEIIAQLQPSESVYFVKIDVQGYESHVINGLLKSLSQGKVKHVMFEFWPDALDDAANKMAGSCIGVHNILMPLANLGYTLYDLTVAHHPNAETKGKELRVDSISSLSRPLDFDNNCGWFVEKGLITPNYEMGYWTDIVATRDQDLLSQLQHDPMYPKKVVRRNRITMN